MSKVGDYRITRIDGRFQVQRLGDIWTNHFKEEIPRTGLFKRLKTRRYKICGGWFEEWWRELYRANTFEEAVTKLEMSREGNLAYYPEEYKPIPLRGR
jgi:hypothetical protein